MRALTLAALALLAPSAVSGQADLPKAPRVALEAYLASAPAYRLLPDSVFVDRNGFDGARPGVENSFRPYWRVGDFNADGLEDLAALVFGPPAQRQRGWGRPKSHEARAVVLHGQADRTFRVAAEVYTEIPYTSVLLQADTGKLGWTVWETDAVVLLLPDGDGYRPTTPLEKQRGWPGKAAFTANERHEYVFIRGVP